MDTQKVRIELVNQLRSLLDDGVSDDDPGLSKSLGFFSGSLTTFLNTLVGCENPTNKSEAACNILQRLFFVCEGEQISQKRDPLLFDDNSMLIRSCESLVEHVRKTCGDIKNAIEGAASSSSLALGSEKHGTGTRVQQLSSTLLEDIVLTREKLEKLRLDVGHFCSQVSQQFRVRVVFSVEIEKTLHFWTENWKSYTPNERQQISKCVATLLETRLERQWFGEFLEHTKHVQEHWNHSSLEVVQSSLESFRLLWIRDWSKRVEVSQDNVLLLADKLKYTAVRAADEFPSASRPSAFALSLLAKVQYLPLTQRPNSSALVKTGPREALRRADNFAKNTITRLHDQSVRDFSTSQ